MYLKRLSLQGFKSFAGRTTFDFTGGVTSIVGPNGSGKSNVADAVRWVLGEQSIRLLRARKQEDVIFSGTGDRAAVGMAEVLLTLDNSDRWLPVDFAEVEVGRRVYRNGDSEYLLNGSRVRLRDVNDLLMKGDVGQNSYTIMGQGLVDEVLSMSPAERREFLDEAADVRGFRIKIKEAQDRLAATRENIARVTLIVSEIEPRLAQLSRQAERAAEHTRLAAELADLLRAYFGDRWNDAQNRLVAARAALDQSTAGSTGAEARLETLREQLRALGDEIRKRREAIARRDSRTSEFEQQVSAAEHAITLDRERLSMIAGRRDELRLEVEALDAEREALVAAAALDGTRETGGSGELEEAKADSARRRDELEAAERDYNAARGKLHELQEARGRDAAVAATAREQVSRATVQLSVLESEGQRLVQAHTQALAGLRAYGRRYAEVLEQVVEAEYTFEDARAAATELRERLQRVQDEVRRYEANGSKDLRELDHLEGRLDALRRVQAEHDGVAAGTRNSLIMGQALVEGVPAGSLGENAEINGVIGLLARQVKVPAGLEKAINAALETRLHAVVVQSEAAALKAIELLFQRRHGRAQFIALDGLRHVYPLNLQKERGVVGVASKLVRCDQRFRPLVDTLLGRVIVVEDAPTGLRMIHRGLGTVVTLDGTFIESAGMLSGGATGADEGPFVRQRELEELPARIEQLRARTAVVGRQVQQARAAIEDLAAQAEDAENAYAELRQAMDDGRSVLARERDRLHRLRREIDAVRAQGMQGERERTRLEQSLLAAREALALSAANDTGRAPAISSAEAALQEALDRREAALRAVADAGGRLASVEGERRAQEAIREQHQKAIERLASQAAARRLQAKNSELEVGVIEQRLSRLSAELEALRAEQLQQDDDAAPDRDELTRLETHERQVQDEYAAAQAAMLDADRRRLDLGSEVARLEESIESLRAEMAREGLAADATGAVVPFDQFAGAALSVDGAIDAAQAAVRGAALLDPEATRLRVEEIRRLIRRLGPINEEAPEDYRESKERFDFLSGQLRDLSDAEGQLRDAISELSGEIKSRFESAFSRVDIAFGEYFTAFFGGGSARLLLDDPDNSAEAGVEIEATPPGKRIKSLTLLSGGERSLTAVALLFALLTVNPAPFCVLDEVDAALDEANVGRFSSSLASLAEKTQFVVITHNRRTLEVANAIYGVSMGRDGVSKVLSLRLADIPKD